MHYALYVSSAVHPFSAEELDELLRISRKNNEAADISGMLLYHDGNFIQYIEGYKQALDKLMSRINADPRHRGVIVLDIGECADRVFPDWTMGFERISEEDLERHGAFDLSRVGLEKALNPALPKAVLIMMRTFYNSGHRHRKD